MPVPWSSFRAKGIRDCDWELHHGRNGWWEGECLAQRREYFRGQGVSHNWVIIWFTIQSRTLWEWKRSVLIIMLGWWAWASGNIWSPTYNLQIFEGLLHERKIRPYLWERVGQCTQLPEDMCVSPYNEPQSSSDSLLGNGTHCFTRWYVSHHCGCQEFV